MFLTEEKDIITVNECYLPDEIIQESVFSTLGKIYNSMKSKFAELFHLSKTFYNANKEILDNQNNYKGVTIEKAMDVSYVNKCANLYMAELKNLLYLVEHIEDASVNMKQYENKIRSAIKLADMNSIFFRKPKINSNAKFNQSDIKKIMINPSSIIKWEEIIHMQKKIDDIVHKFNIETRSSGHKGLALLPVPMFGKDIDTKAVDYTKTPSLGPIKTLIRIEVTNTDLICDIYRTLHKDVFTYAKKAVKVYKN